MRLLLICLLAAPAAAATRIPRLPAVRAQVGVPAAAGAQLGALSGPTLQAAPSITLTPTPGLDIAAAPSAQAADQNFENRSPAAVSTRDGVDSAAVPTVRGRAVAGAAPGLRPSAKTAPRSPRALSITGAFAALTDTADAFDFSAADGDDGRLGALFDNTMKTRRAAFRAANMRPYWDPGSDMSSRLKHETSVQRQRDDAGVPRVFKWYRTHTLAANELAYRAIFNYFPQLRGLFTIPQAVGYRGLMPRGGAGLIMEDLGPLPQPDKYAELPLAQKVGTALIQTFGSSDLNSNAFSVPREGRPTLLDLEHLGFPLKPAPAGDVRFDSPWISNTSLNYADDYVPALRRWQARLEDPQTRAALDAMLKAAGMGWWRRKREMRVIYENLELLEATIRSDLDAGNYRFLSDAKNRGKLTGEQARVLSAVNRAVLKFGDRGYVDFLRLILHQNVGQDELERERFGRQIFTFEEARAFFAARPDGLTAVDRAWARAHGWAEAAADFDALLAAPPAVPAPAYTAKDYPRTSTVTDWNYESWFKRLARLLR